MYLNQVLYGSYQSMFTYVKIKGAKNNKNYEEKVTRNNNKNNNNKVEITT